MSEAEPITATPTTATLVFLWADTFAATLTQQGQRGIVSPSTGAIVDTRALAEMMVAVTLAELHTTGAIRLEPYTKKSFGLLSSSGINVRTTGDVPARGPIGERIAKSGKARDKGESVADIVTAALHRSEQPDGLVVQWGIDEAVELGYMTRAGAGGLRGLTGATKVEPVKERVESTRARAVELAETWKAFRDADPELAKSVRTAVRKGIDVRRVNTDRELQRELSE